MDARETLLNAVRELEPAIRDAAVEAELNRRVPPGLLDQLLDAGFFQMMIPRALGGLEVEPSTVFEVIEAISRIDGSIGWIVMIGSGTPGFIVPYLPEAAANTVVLDNPKAIMGGLLSPRGRAVPVEGGYRVSGRWPFGSGCEHSTWLASGAIVFDGDAPRTNGDGQPEFRLMVMRTDELEILDTWSVMGLRGSGSHDYVAADVFVPEDFAVVIDPAHRAHDGHLYDVLFVLCCHAAQALGVARHAIDVFHTYAQAVPHSHAVAVRERPLAQMRAAEAEALVASARAYMLSALDDAWRSATAGEGVSIAQRVQFRLAMTNAVQRSADAIASMYDAAGAWAIYSANPLEKCFRDIHVATQHFVVATPSYETLGRILLGVDESQPFLL